MSSKPASVDQYGPAARSIFKQLVALFSARQSASSYWKLGNSFDTILDFLDFDSTDAEKLPSVLQTQYAVSLKDLHGYDSAWFDDFGWWTVAFQRAAQRTYFSSSDREYFVSTMKECWTRFTDRGPKVWERHTKDTFDDCGPAVPGGVWNEYWEGTDSKKWPGPNDGIPDSTDPKQSLHGIQNTVTNTVYLIAAQRLGVTAENANADAEREFKFLQSWFEVRSNTLWWPQPANNAAHVRERVSHFAPSSRFPTGKMNKFYQSDWAWTGDQGLVVGALADRMRLMSGGPKERSELLEKAKALIAGARYYLRNSMTGQLLSFTTTGQVPGNDYDDYQTGPGVFWRNMLHAWNVDPDLKAFLNQPAYTEWLKLNAEFAIKSQKSDFDSLTNDLSVVVAAAVMLKPSGADVPH
jgi:hypothetical protein